MKLQNLTVIFIIIVLPIILILSYYISLQIDTSNMQASYNTKLIDATKEAIEAFEINTVEWNEAYSETGDSKRRDVMASINTFTNSFANSLGVGGATRDYILPYVPAIAFTMYDGYYIYSPTETKVVIEDENGVGVTMTDSLLREKIKNGASVIQGYKVNNLENDQGKILYQLDARKGNADGTYQKFDKTTEELVTIPFTLDASEAEVEYSHMLKPFNSYSAKYGDIIINYTLDNYITIYGSEEGDYIKSGYLINTSSVEFEGEDNKIKTIKVNGSTVGPETLTETIYYNGLQNPTSYPYVYEAQNNTKVYFDGDTPFQVSSTGERTNLEDTTTVMYKKISILSSDGDDQYFEIFQALNNGEAYSNERGETIDVVAGDWYLGTELPTGDIRIIEEAGNYGQREEITTDYSAMNYYVESFAFTNWVNSNLSDITTEDMKNATEDSKVEEGGTEEQVVTVSGGDNIFGSDVDYESEGSVFQIHKKEVMRNLLINNLNQAITSYAGTNTETEYQLPVLEETDWDQILNNVSITTFVQGIPIGMKYYNNYAIATSTNNKEYVNPDGIYLTGSDDEYYHIYGCSEIPEGNLIGYRSTDYIVRSYKIDENKTRNYTKHSDPNSQGSEELTKLCYYCLVDRNQMGEIQDDEQDDEQDRAYLTALARERYNVGKTRMDVASAPVTEEPDPPEPEEPEVPDPPVEQLTLTIRIYPSDTGWINEQIQFKPNLYLDYDVDGTYNTKISYTGKDGNNYEHNAEPDESDGKGYIITEPNFETGWTIAAQRYNVTIETTDENGNKYTGSVEFIARYSWNGGLDTQFGQFALYRYTLSFENTLLFHQDTKQVTLNLKN